MKKILTLAVILGITVAGAPYLAGQFTENHLHNKIDGSLGQRAAEHLNLKLGLENYQRGYASSTATLTISEGEHIRRYPLNIRHAPLTFTGFDITRITIKHPTEAQLPDGDLRVNLLRNLTYTQHVPAEEKNGNSFKGADITIKGPEKGFPLNNTLTLDMHGVQQGKSTFEPAQITFNYTESGLTLNSPVIHYRDDDIQATLRNPQVSLPFITVDGKHLPARVEYRLGESSFKTDDGDIDLSLRENSLLLGIEEESSTYNLIARLDSQFTIAGETASQIKMLLPVVPDQFHFDYTLKNLSPQSVQAAADLFRQAKALRGDNSAAALATDSISQLTQNLPSNTLDAMVDSKERSEVLVDQLQRDLLARDLGLHLAFALNGAGKGIGVDITLAEHIKSEADLETFKNSGKPPLAQYLHGSRLHAHIDRAVLGGLLGQLLSADELERMHFAAADDRYTLDFAINTDGYQLNGKPLSDDELADFMRDLFGAALGAEY
ncbi:DUF945 family protein [Cardiobacterium valvarum]|uniref:Bacterial protein of uncharacterized function (DUF945) n=1 Tax=Cardiobacterium valvarum TaxID=194702 RepID=A0A381E0L3_9GAMM|nr:DUF945 family protein [Cardiobacterium valvarum]SUX19254.1 Bacterial protein of uncharacterised function (DUF945) [Cardiobacterium valvarum]